MVVVGRCVVLVGLLPALVLRKAFHPKKKSLLLSWRDFFMKIEKAYS